MGAPAPALRLAGAAGALRTDAEPTPRLAPRDPPPLPDSLETAWQELGDDRAWAAWTAGQELGWGAAIGAARQLLGELPASPDPMGPGTPAALSPLVSPAVRPR